MIKIYKSRTSLGVLTCLLGGFLFGKPLYQLAILSLNEDFYSHTFFIPIVSLYILWIKRKTLFNEISFSPLLGGVFLFLGLCIAGLQHSQLITYSGHDALTVWMIGVLLWIFGGFIIFFGSRVFHYSLFPMLFLLFMIPIPGILLEPIVRGLQLSSASASYWTLKAIGIPIYKEDSILALTGVTVEVAPQCSGIRSGLVLLILCTFASYLFLESGWRRFVFIVASIPISIFKNGLRIATLAFLGSYVDMHYITDSALHSSGGKPFLILAVIIMAPILWGLRRSEKSQDMKLKEDALHYGRVSHS